MKMILTTCLATAEQKAEPSTSIEKSSHIIFMHEATVHLALQRLDYYSLQGITSYVAKICLTDIFSPRADFIFSATSSSLGASNANSMIAFDA